MATTFPTKSLVLQGDLDAANFTILNLDLTGLNLTKASVGLGNVDNTSDANKPISTATQTALDLKEPDIALGTTAQYWRGDKTWQTLGALALQGGATTLSELSAIGANATSLSFLRAKRSDFPSSNAGTAIVHFGASYPGTILTGLNKANAGVLEFLNSTHGVIYTNNASPIIFGTNGIKRMRLMLGLNVGGDGDPGAGCITCYDKMSTAHFLGTDLVLTGGATFNDDVVIAGGGSTLTVGGNTTVGGTLTATLGLSTPSTITGGGNMAVVGSIISFSGLPTSDPGVVGRLWRSGADVKVSI